MGGINASKFHVPVFLFFFECPMMLKSLALFFVVGLLLPIAANGQEDSFGPIFRSAALLQDEPISIPRAIFADLERGKLRVQVAQANFADEANLLDGAQLVVTTATGESIRVPVDADGSATLENIPEGPVGLQLLGPSIVMSTETRFGREVNDLRDAEPASIRPARARKEEISRSLSYLPRDVSTNPNDYDFSEFDVNSTLPQDLYRISLQPGNRLVGRVIVMDGKRASGYAARATNVMLYDVMGEPLDRTVSGNDGSFEFLNVRAGNYGIVASGRSGYAAYGFEAVEDQLFRNVSFNQAAPPSSGLTVLLTPEFMIPSVVENIQRDFLGGPPGGGAGVGIPFPGAGAGFGPGGGGEGGGGSGGGGSGGLGGIGGLILPAAIAAGVAAVASDNSDDNNFIPPVASPAIP